MDFLPVPVLPRALLASGAIAVAAYLLTPASDQNSVLPDGKPARKIHALECGYPFLQNLVDRVSNGERLHHWLNELSLRFNAEPWKFKVPGQPEVLVFTMPEEIEAITVTNSANFPKGEFQIEILVDMFGAGLVASDGERWMHQRKASARFFSARTLRTLMMQSMQKNINTFSAVLEEAMQVPGKQVDLRHLFHEFTIETFAELGMGVSLDCIGAATPHPFQKALGAAAPTTARRFRLPGWYWKLERWLNVGREAEMTDNMKIVRDWLGETINKSLANATAKREQRSENGKPADGDVKSIVELFVEFGREDADGLQPEDLLPFMLTFVIGARDTTAATLCWFFYVLATNPEIEKKIREEMVSKLGTQEIPYLTTDHIKSLTYLEATIKEIIRLYPAAPFTMRQAAEDIVICGDIFIRKGQLIGTSPYAIARNPRVWGPDAADFRPERWIDQATGQILQVPASKFFSFNAGPRTCIGMNLALLELRIVTANLLHRYKFHIDPSNDGSYEVAPTLNMKHPLLARVTPWTKC